MKSFFLSSLVLMVSLMAVGCGGGDKPAAPSTPAASEPAAPGAPGDAPGAPGAPTTEAKK